MLLRYPERRHVADHSFVCRCIVAVLDKALEKASGTQFKVLFFLSRKVGSSGGEVSSAEIERATHIGRNAVRRAVQALVALGLVAVQVAAVPAVGRASTIAVTAIASAASELPQEPAYSPPEAASAAAASHLPSVPHLKEYSSVWDVLHPLNKTIREPLSDSIVRTAMKIGREWNRNGYQVAAMIYKRTKWYEVKQFGPRKWIYILNALKMGFEAEVRGEREEQRHVKAEKARQAKRVVNIEEQSLPFVAGPDTDFSEQIERTAFAKRLPNAASAS